MVITDAVAAAADDGTTTPAGDADDDFFASWDKPSIKRPTPPVSRTATPPVVGRSTPSNLSANPNGSAATRPKSPLAATENASSTEAPSATRTTSSSAIRKSAAGGAPRKANVLGAKRAPKLGAKKVTGGEMIDFEEAERKAKEEAERAEKLGYNPEAEAVEAASEAKPASTATEPTKIASPTPISPKKAGFGAMPARERSSSEMERLGMGMGRLGFGQIGGGNRSAPPSGSSSTSAPARKMGFGSTGQKPTSTGEDDEGNYATKKFGNQKGISSDEFFGRGEAFDASAKAEAKSRLQGFEGSTSISSNAYFGRPEDDNAADEYGNYGDLESAAKDFVRKFGVTAGDDIEHLTHALGEGASKLQSTSFSFPS